MTTTEPIIIDPGPLPGDPAPEPVAPPKAGHKRLYALVGAGALALFVAFGATVATVLPHGGGTHSEKTLTADFMLIAKRACKAGVKSDTMTGDSASDNIGPAKQDLTKDSKIGCLYVNIYGNDNRTVVPYTEADNLDKKGRQYIKTVDAGNVAYYACKYNVQAACALLLSFYKGYDGTQLPTTREELEKDSLFARDVNGTKTWPSDAAYKW